MWDDKNCGRGYIKGHTVPTVAFCLMKKNESEREKNRWKRWYKGKSTKKKKRKLGEMAKKQFRFWTNIKYCVPCQNVNFISYREASSGRRKWSRVACSSPKLTETRTNQPFELLSIRESELQLEPSEHNRNLISHAKFLHSAHTIYLCIP